MKKTIMITGSTDGIGLKTAGMLISQGHEVLIHGRSKAKLDEAKRELSRLTGGDAPEGYAADLSVMDNVEKLAKEVSEGRSKLDVLINNAGVFTTPHTVTGEGLDVRFAVNTIAPYLLTRRLLPLLGLSSRVIGLSSAAQSPVNPEALSGKRRLSDGEAYAQSKLALTMWSRSMALSLREEGPVFIAVNPGSFLGSKMVKEAYGIEGKDLGIGADILTRAALSDEFADASGRYFDNDSGQFASPHPDALDSSKCEEMVRLMEEILRR